MNLSWKIDLEEPTTDVRAVEDTAMQLIKDFRAIPHSQPYKIVFAPYGLNYPVCERLQEAGLPARIGKRKK